MSSAKLMFLLAALWLLVSNIYRVKTEDVSSGNSGSGSAPNACTNCSICQYPCHPQPPPPAPTPPSGYPSYGAPPPPSAQGNCPPAAPAKCCQYSPPMPYTNLPYDNYSASSPLPFPIKPSTTMWSSVIFFLLHFVFVFHV